MEKGCGHGDSYTGEGKGGDKGDSAPMSGHLNSSRDGDRMTTTLQGVFQTWSDTILSH